MGDIGVLRSALLHVLKRVLRDGENLENITAECALHIVKVNIRKIFAHDLLRSIVDQNVNLAEFIDMLLYGVFAGVVLHKVASNKQAFFALLLDELLRLFGIFLFVWEIDDCHISTLSGE